VAVLISFADNTHWSQHFAGSKHLFVKLSYS